MTAARESRGESRSSEASRALTTNCWGANKTSHYPPANKGSQASDDDPWAALGRRRQAASTPATAAAAAAATEGGGGAVGSKSGPATEKPASRWGRNDKEDPPRRRNLISTAQGSLRDRACPSVPESRVTSPVELSPRPVSEKDDASDLEHLKVGRSEEALVSTQAKVSPGRGGKRARGRGGASKVEGLPRSVRISKTLTQILRHRAIDLGVKIRPDGYCRLTEVLAVSWLSELDCTLADVEEVVKESDKKRFDMMEEDGERLIRAAQGHSIKVVEDECLLRRLTAEDEELPDTCVHGTYRRHFEKIRAGGLLAGGTHGQSFRKHVHFSPFNPFDHRVISGMRFDCEVAIWIDLRRALEDGLPFYMSANQVILSPGENGRVDQRYFIKAEDLKSGQTLDLHAPAALPAAKDQPKAKAKAKSEAKAEAEAEAKGV